MVSAMQVMKVNFLGMRHLNEALMPRMTPQGRIVIVASSIGRDWQENGERVNALLDQPCFETGKDWLSTSIVGTKTLTSFPSNARRRIPTALPAWGLNRLASIA